MPAAKAKKTKAAKPEKTKATKNPSKTSEQESSSLFEQLLDIGGRIAIGAVDVAKAGSAVPLMLTDNLLKDIYMKSIDHERLNSMIEAGRFLQDAREVAGLNIQELAEALGLSDTELLEEVEKGQATLPFDMALRIASLIARHDPVPFVIKFVRTYNPALEDKMEQWGIAALPKEYERERRFINLLRQHDELRTLSDEEYERFIGYQQSAVAYTLDVMAAEKKAHSKKHRSSKTSRPTKANAKAK